MNWRTAHGMGMAPEAEAVGASVAWFAAVSGATGSAGDATLPDLARDLVGDQQQSLSGSAGARRHEVQALRPPRRHRSDSRRCQEGYDLLKRDGAAAAAAAAEQNGNACRETDDRPVCASARGSPSASRGWPRTHLDPMSSVADRVALSSAARPSTERCARLPAHDAPAWRTSRGLTRGRCASGLTYAQRRTIAVAVAEPGQLGRRSAVRRRRSPTVPMSVLEPDRAASRLAQHGRLRV